MVDHIIQCACGLHAKLTIEPQAHVTVACLKCKKKLFPPLAPAAAKSTAPERPPTRPQTEVMIDHYLVGARLGKGGMGEIFFATNTKTHQKEVIKLLYEPTEEMVAYFIREAQILLTLQHPAIVQCTGYGNFQGRPYIVMEFVDGKNLAEVLVQEGRLKLSQAIPIIFNLASVLEYAESLKIIHRDITPSNIMVLTKDPNSIKLIDFGLAKSLGDYYNSHTNTGITMGKTYYIPPEQIQDAKRADHRADIYGLGATFYHMLAGQPPFWELRNTKDFRSLLMKIISQPYTPLAQLRPNLPQEIYTIVSKAMASQVEKRYQSASEIKRDLKIFLEKIHKIKNQ